MGWETDLRVYEKDVYDDGSKVHIWLCRGDSGVAVSNTKESRLFSMLKYYLETGGEHGSK